MNAIEWAHEHGIKCTLDNLTAKELWRRRSEARFQADRKFYNIAIHIKKPEGEKKILTIEYSPSPLHEPVTSEQVYDDALSFLYFYCDWGSSSDKDEQGSIEMARKFVGELSEQAAHEFVNGWIDFHE